MRTVEGNVLKLPRLLVLDVSKPGGAGATGQLSRTLFDAWPAGRLMHLHWDVYWSWRVFDGERSELIGIEEVEARCRDFRPDVIYYRPVPFPASFHQMAAYLLEKLKCPYAVHLMDDWMKRLETKGDEAFDLFDQSIRVLLEKAALRISICEAMSDAFERRYRVPFVAVANGVQSEQIAKSRGNGGVPDPFVIRYCGGLADDMTRRSVKRLAEAVESLQEKRSVRLEVYTKQHYELAAAKDFLGRPGVKVYESVPDSEYERLLRTADGLLIAYNFDELSLAYTRYSFANKLPECMASGTPVLAFGPVECASIRFLAENECAFVVGQNDRQLLANVVEEMVLNSKLRESLSRKARELVYEKFLLEENRSKFHELLMKASKSNVVVATSEILSPFPEPISGSGRRDAAILFNEYAFLDTLLKSGGSLSISVSCLVLGSHSEQSKCVMQGLGWKSHESLRLEDYCSVLSVEDTSAAMSLISGYVWNDASPDAIVIRFEDRASEVEGFNTHQLAVTLRRKGYRVLVSEWYPREVDATDAWNRLCPYPCCLLSPLAWGRLIAFREETSSKVLSKAVERGLSDVSDELCGMVS